MTAGCSHCMQLYVCVYVYEDQVRILNSPHLFAYPLAKTSVEGEHGFLYDCPVYSSLRASQASPFQQTPHLA